jgi:FkbM family methyltransferase
MGYENYLKWFSIFKIKTLKYDRRKSDFLFFSEQLDDSATIIVIGACTGITTVPLAKGKINRTVIAYEPLKSNFTVLKKVISHFKLKNVHTNHLGLGNKTEQRDIILPVVNGAKKHGLAHIMDSTIHRFNEGIIEKIDLDCLDNRAELTSLNIDALKIVAENFEYQIFEGAKSIIEKNKPLIYCELWENERRQLVLDLVKTYNYTIYVRKDNTLIPFDGNNYTGKNFFFKPTNA